jgi:hypothetical protein
MAIRTIANDIDDILVLKSLQNLDFLLNRLDALSISRKELVSKQFEGHVLLWVLERSGEIYLRSISLSERRENLIFIVEDRMFLLGVHGSN